MAPDEQAGCFTRLFQRFQNHRSSQKDTIQGDTEAKPKCCSELSNGTRTPGAGDELRDATVPEPNVASPIHDGASQPTSVEPAVTDDIESANSQRNPSGATLSRSSISTPPHSTTTSYSIHKALWEKAYSDLKSDKKKAKYMEKYEELLSTVFLGRDEVNQGLGEEQMKELVALGLEKVERYKAAGELLGSKLEVVTAIKNILDIPMTKITHTALPWAIISSSVDVKANNIRYQILLKPVKAGAELYNSVGYVVSRIEWYSNFTDQLLRQERIGDEGPLTTIRKDIEARIIDLYQSLLFYQIKSVCFYYKKQLFVLARGILDLDDWSRDLQGVKDAEDHLLRDSSLYKLECLNDKVRDISMDQKTQKDIESFHGRLHAISHVDPENIEVPIDDLYAWTFRTDAFRRFSRWEEQDAPRRLWISGQAGTGKTMLLIGAIKQIQTSCLLKTASGDPPVLIYFFCQSSDDKLNNGAAPGLLQHLQKKFSSSGDKFIYDRHSIFTWQDILIDMLSDCDRVIVVIDAIDECDEVSRRYLRNFLDGILHMDNLSHVKWLISSRPMHELPASMPSKASERPRLLTLDDRILSPLINAYISRKMSDIQERATNKEHVVEIKDQLCERASNTFIWASLVIRKLEESPEFKWKRILAQIPDHLYQLYGFLLEGIEDQECKDVLAVAMLARRPLTLLEIEHLAGLETGMNAGKDSVILCKSFLTLRSDTVYLIHQSAQDWLIQHHYRLRNISLQGFHTSILQRSLEGLDEVLRENIYMLPHYGLLTQEVKPPTDNPLSSIRYSCQSWVYHLKESNITLPRDILDFLRAHFIHWLEAMALLGLLPETVEVVDVLQSLEAFHADPELADYLIDAKRFILKNLPVVTLAPLQLYVSALILTPMNSLVRSTGSLPSWICKPTQVDENWGCLLQILEHQSGVHSVAFSPDDRLLAGTDATGALHREVEHGYDSGHLTRVEFSPNKQSLVSGSSEGQIHIWDTKKWHRTQTLRPADLSCRISDTAFSPDSQMLTCSSEHTVNVWKKSSTTWNLQWNFNPSEEITSISFSCNGLLLGSAMWGHIIIWNMETGALHHTIQRLDSFTTVRFSTDNKSLLAGFRSDGVIIWDINDWSLKQIIPNADQYSIFSLSPDNNYIAAPGNNSITVMKADMGVIYQTLKGHHTGHIEEVTFSSDSRLLASCGSDKTIHLWAIAPGGFTDNPNHHSELITTVAFSTDGSLVATGARDSTIKIWDAETGHLISTMDNMGHSINTVKISPKNKLLASGSDDGSVTVRNIQTGESIVARNGCGSYQYERHIREIHFSRSSRLLAAVPVWDVEVWNTKTGNLVKSALQGLAGEELQEALESLEQNMYWAKTKITVEDEIPYDDAQPSQQCQISIADGWVILGQQKRIWIPPEHRP
ncbi:WD40 repeat-like protein [Aspergillus sclerotioniger CBS 115572]|uniref:WD40 repeat-like protein n=1 Tax=Aspergillus sclerotioniger CBS 115572 TaxID=1450535 RepID=A0A317VLR0_9EURO|nr:WD40 repeat-like protein [Aspergillus sclerotioniger CBS 115572]PWY75304.1 WD40 repeat-like protein [Aspergillus sclerotioniger CBS 115572]